ncbi:MAG: TetR/AcrR family transcriptional regulator [Thiolinea sp.]
MAFGKTQDQQPMRRDAAQNREQIIASARQLFTAQGVSETSMNQIAQAAGVGAGTLYRNFSHKGDLCLALLRDDLGAFRKQVNGLLMAADAPDSALERLELLVDKLLKMIEINIPLLIGMQEAYAGDRRPDIYHSPYYQWLHESFSTLLQEAVERGEAAELDICFTADALFAVTAPPLMVFQQQRGFERQRILDGVRRLFIQGLMTKGDIA